MTWYYKKGESSVNWSPFQSSSAVALDTQSQCDERKTQQQMYTVLHAPEFSLFYHLKN